MGDVAPPERGTSSSFMRSHFCKDCQREVKALQAALQRLTDTGAPAGKIAKAGKALEARKSATVYNERRAVQNQDRGLSRSDRCAEHRRVHAANLQGLAVGYIDLQTVGEVTNRTDPTGPLGGLGPLPGPHKVIPRTEYPLQEVKVGMTDADIVEIIDLLRDKRVLVLKAGTGTGKSTFAPYRLLDPPPESIANAPAGADFVRLSDLGQIVVTEPRVQAAIGVASFVGGVMSGAGGFGAGFPVGYQVKGDRNHDASCQLLYVTDGTMINWLREGRLSEIGTVIVDEAHERSTNIDFIMGFLAQQLGRYPHLRVIITSATFDTNFYQAFFGGPEVAHVKIVDPTKPFGYGMPLFPCLDAPEPGEESVLERWRDPELPLRGAACAPATFIAQHWKSQYAPELGPDDLAPGVEPAGPEDVRATTETLLGLRYQASIPSDQWREKMPDTLADFVIDLAKGLDEAGIYGDILGFLPTTKTIEDACARIEAGLSKTYREHVFPLISTLPRARQTKALAARRYGDPRKIVISTNLAETSLTVEGVRFVVDSGLIAQSYWEPELAQGGVKTTLHSQAGVRQRWGRVGRKAPGWVFPLYTKGQFLDLPTDTPPESTRQNLEALVMTAKMGGVDDVVGFKWPVAYTPPDGLDPSAVGPQNTFNLELRRADRALRTGGAVDDDGHPTSFGREIARFSGLGTTASALALLYADRLACVPEVATILALLEDTRLIGRDSLLLDNFTWPEEWRLEAAGRHRGIASLCADDAELVLTICAAWERADPHTPPWEASELRARWARQWWVSDEVLRAAAVRRQDALAALSPAMKEEVKRFVEPALIGRARGVIARAFAAHHFDPSETDPATLISCDTPPSPAIDIERADGEDATPTPPPGPLLASIERDSLFRAVSVPVIALRRRGNNGVHYASNFVAYQDWVRLDHALPVSSLADAMGMVVRAARSARPDPTRNRVLELMGAWPVGLRVSATVDDSGQLVEVTGRTEPFPHPLDVEGRSTGRRARRPRRPVDEDDAALVDAASDLSVFAGRPGAVDERTVADRAFAASDREVDATERCGVCLSCTSGRNEPCENAIDTSGASGERLDALSDWRRAVRDGERIATPTVVLEPGSTGSLDRFEVVGYQLNGETPVLVARPDWRPVGFTGSPAQHHDVAPGQPIDVVVGPLLSHHGGTVRSFIRADGQGRFVMREASAFQTDKQEARNEIAVSLARNTKGLLERLVPGATLTATVVPAPVAGCFTITLLELLHQHLSRAAAGRGLEYHVAEPGSKRSVRKPFYLAEVVTEPSQSGYATAMLAHRDQARGVAHLVEFAVVARSDQDAPPEDDATGPSPLALGDGVLIHLVRDVVSVDVGGLDLSVLEEIVTASDRQLELVDGRRRSDKSAKATRPKKAEKAGDTATTSGSPSNDDSDEIGAPIAEPAAPAAVLKAVSSKPLSRHAAARLVTLDDSAAWSNEVWAFWARSHHLRVDSKTPFLPAARPDLVDVEATVKIATETPLEERRQLAAAVAETANSATIYETIVERLADEFIVVSLTINRDGHAVRVEGRVARSELSWLPRAPISELVSVGESMRLRFLSWDEQAGVLRFSRNALIPDPFAAYAAAHPVNAVVTGQVTKLHDFAASLELGPGVDGFVQLGEMSWTFAATPADVLEVGQEVTAKVLKISAERRSITVSIKQGTEHPIAIFARYHHIGDRIIATVARLSERSVWVDVGGGVEALVRSGELAWVATTPSAVATPGQRLDVKITDIDVPGRQVCASFKQLTADPFVAFARKVSDAPCRALVTATNKGGVVIELAPGVVGFVANREVDWGSSDAAKSALNPGDVIKVVVLEVDDKTRQIMASIKKLVPPPLERFLDRHPVNSVVDGVVKSFVKDGVVVELATGVTGYLHVSEIAATRVAQASDAIDIGQSVRVLITKADATANKISLSIKKLTTLVPPARSVPAVRPWAAPAAVRHTAAAPPSVPVSRPSATQRHAPAPAARRTAIGSGASQQDAMRRAAQLLGVPFGAVLLLEVIEEPKRSLLGRSKGEWKVSVTT